MAKHNKEDAKRFLPDSYELEEAATVCWNLARYIELTEPNATNAINILKGAADELNDAAAAADFGEDDEDGEDVS